MAYLKKEGGIMTILNAAVLTNYGLYYYEELTVEQAREQIELKGFKSAIGHKSIARIISDLLEIDCPVNRVQYKQHINECALVFKLNTRVSEWRNLSQQEIEEIGYSFGYLLRLE